MCQQGTHDASLFSQLREGLKLDLLGERWRAIRCLENLLRAHPNFYDARGHLAWIYSLQGNNSAAIAHLKMLLESDPENLSAIGRIQDLEREWSQSAIQGASSEEAYARALQLATDSSREVKSRQREALVSFRVLWERLGDVNSLLWVSRLAYDLQDFPTCLEATREFLKRNPDSVEFLRRLGQIHEHLGEREPAVEAYRQVLARDPSAVGVQANLVILAGDSSDTIPKTHPLSQLFSRSTRDCEVDPEKDRDSVWRRLADFFRQGEPSARRVVNLSRQLKGDPGFHSSPCNLCGGEEFIGVAIGGENGWPIMRCTGCGLIQTHPQPTQETLTRKYQEQYYGEGSIDTARGIHESPPIGETPMTMLPRVMDYLIGQGLADFETSRSEKRMLDIGCGEGILMRDFRIRGWACEGTEVSEPAIEFLREKGYIIYEGILSQIEDLRGDYDLVTMSHVIEHVRDPLGDLRKIHSLMAPGGWIFVTTPGADSLPSRIAGEDWFYDPDHIFFFSKQTLQVMLEAAGFEVSNLSAYVGVGRETWEEAWLREGLGPSVMKRVEEMNMGDVL
ncbi:MAG: methyltransferase domain-containing protein, partial [Candidatus Omnitrophica bacterium]|nr:methyltransferase domain-containing protein [Candidatus Omnitrophota bacterium]